MHETSFQPDQASRNRTAVGPGVLTAVLIALLAFGPGVPSARAASSDEKLLSITKTTVYGALLGGLLGLAGALIVDKDHRDDAVRWGVALGSFGGFGYGVVTSREDDLDDFSFRLPRDRSRGSGSIEDGARNRFDGGALAHLRSVRVFHREEFLSGIEVGNGGLEEKSGGEQAIKEK